MPLVGYSAPSVSKSARPFDPDTYHIINPPIVTGTIGESGHWVTGEVRRVWMAVLTPTPIGDHGLVKWEVTGWMEVDEVVDVS